MAIKPSNVVDSLRDKLVEVAWDLDVASTSATLSPFVDFSTDYNVVEITGIVIAATGTSAAATVKVGYGAYGSEVADDDAFVASVVRPLSASAGATVDFTLVEEMAALPAGAPLTVTRTVGGDASTGVILMQIRLRPRDYARSNRTKRPSAAQTP